MVLFVVWPRGISYKAHTYIMKFNKRTYPLTAFVNDFHFWQRPSFNLLSQAQLDHIYAAAGTNQAVGNYENPPTPAVNARDFAARQILNFIGVVARSGRCADCLVPLPETA